MPNLDILNILLQPPVTPMLTPMLTPAPTPTTFVPPVVSRFQGEAILLTDGILDDVENLVLQGDAMVQLAWKRATEFRRQSPMVLQIAASLGWTDAYIDSLFIRGSEIVA